MNEFEKDPTEKVAGIIEGKPYEDFPAHEDLTHTLSDVDEAMVEAIFDKLYAKYQKKLLQSPQWVIVYGELGDGLQGIVGPFDTENQAEYHAETNSLGHYEKCIYQLEVPEWAKG